jgi:hypothetical protein
MKHIMVRMERMLDYILSTFILFWHLCVENCNNEKTIWFFDQMDDFEVDSFVVNNSEVEFESSLDELDMVDEFESDDDGKRKTR